MKVQHALGTECQPFARNQPGDGLKSRKKHEQLVRGSKSHKTQYVEKFTGFDQVIFLNRKSVIGLIRS